MITTIKHLVENHSLIGNDQLQKLRESSHRFTDIANEFNYGNKTDAEILDWCRYVIFNNQYQKEMKEKLTAN